MPCGLPGPPFAQVALAVELRALIVEAVGHFVSDDYADAAVVHRRIDLAVKNGGCRMPAGKLMSLNDGL